LEESPPVAIQLEAIEPVVCHGQNTGSIEVSASGGVPSLKFHWSNGQNTAHATQLPAGTYFLTVTDFRGCTTVSTPIEVLEPESPLSVAGAEVVQDVCNKGNGAIYPLAEGGTPSYQYLWSSGSSAAFLENLPPGTYQLTLTDGGGCTLQADWLLEPQPNALELSGFQVQEVVCKGASNGFIISEVTGGHLPLTYFWSNGGSGYFQNNLPAGNYQVTVTDQQGCMEIYTFPTIQEPALELAATYTVIPTGNTFTVVLQCTGGVPAYEAEWGGALNGLTGLELSGLVAGNYPVYITDASGCSINLLVVITTSTTSEPFGGAPFRVFPNPFSSYLVVEQQNPDLKIRQVTLYTALGQVAFQQPGDISSSFRFETNNLPPGYYVLQVIDEQGNQTAYPIVKPN